MLLSRPLARGRETEHVDEIWAWGDEKAAADVPSATGD